jgi:hypothetical protein
MKLLGICAFSFIRYCQIVLRVVVQVTHVWQWLRFPLISGLNWILINLHLFIGRKRVKQSRDHVLTLDFHFIFIDLGEIHSRLLDHRPVIQGETRYFVKEFEVSTH